MGNREKILANWEPVIGLEVHVQLNTKTKMFCGCTLTYGDNPNTHTCPTCLGLPGALPVANEEAIALAVRVGLAFGGTVRETCHFSRKNYFYPDLTKGYQISQFDEPIIAGGSVSFRNNGEEESIGLTRIHLEEDAGKSIHAEAGKETLLDYNRCGAPLIEIVSEPEFRHPAQAKAYLKRIQQTVRFLNISDASMEKGELRCDANISLRKHTEKAFGTKTEMKNMNSFRFVEKALWYEIERQAEVLDSGGTVEQCTLLWNEKNNIAELMRTKEDAHDYRYFPEPDLVKLDLTNGLMDQVSEEKWELPAAAEKRLIEDGLSQGDAGIIAGEKPMLAYYDDVRKEGIESSTAAKWIIGEILRLVKEKQQSINEIGIDPKRLAELISHVEDGTINAGTAKELVGKLCEDDRPVSDIIKEEGLAQISDETELVAAVESVLSEHEDELERYRNGEKQLFGFFMGAAMKAMSGKSDPKMIQKILAEKLG